MKGNRLLLTLNVAFLATLALVGCSNSSNTSSSLVSVASSAETVASSSEQQASSVSEKAQSSASEQAASSASASSEAELEPIETFIASLEGVKNFSIDYQDQYSDDPSVLSYCYKATENAIAYEYYADYQDYYYDSGYISVPNKGIYSFIQDDDGVYQLGNIFSKATNVAVTDLFGSLDFLFTIGDGEWDDGKASGTYTTTDGELVAKLCTLAQYSSGATYCTGIDLSFDDPSNIKVATFTFHFDESEFYEDGSKYDYTITLKDIGTTSITGLDTIATQAAAAKGLTDGFSQTDKAAMLEQAGCELPSLSFDYGSYTTIDKDGTFYFDDLSCGNKCKDYGAELEKLGFVKNEPSSSADETGESVYYEKFIMDGDIYVGVYTIGLYYNSVDLYTLYYGEEYADLYPNGTFEVAASHTTYMTIGEFDQFFSETKYDEETIPRPEFNENPIKLVFEDKTLDGKIWGLSAWYAIQGTFSDHATAVSELNAYCEALIISGGEERINDDTGVAYSLETDGIRYITYYFSAEYYVSIAIICDSTSGGFMIDIEY